MEKESKVLITRTLDHIEKDRLRPEDPFFTSRLMARAEREFSAAARTYRPSVVYMKLKPVLAVAAVALGIFAGIFLGGLLSRVNPVGQATDRSILLEHYANENHINDINGTIEEKLISK
jgi:hypothetical protein